MPEEELEQAIVFIKAGKTNSAIPILKSILKTNRNNELAWHWLASCANNTEDRIYCLQEVLRINPNNSEVKKAIERIRLSAIGEKDVIPTPQPAITVEQQKPYQITKTAVIIVLIVLAFGLIGFVFLLKLNNGMTEQHIFQPYLDKAKELLITNNLDGEPKMVFDREEQGYKFYYLTIYSNEFSKLSQDKIAEILWTLYYLDGRKADGYWITPKVISNGNEFTYDNGMLHKNGSEWYAPSSSSSPEADKQVIGNWFDTNGLPHTIVIKKLNGLYQMTTVFGDGSGETKTLGVKVVNGEERLYENPDNIYGDYMVIKENGDLAFYDDQGFIYELPPKKQ